MMTEANNLKTQSLDGIAVDSATPESALEIRRETLHLAQLSVHLLDTLLALVEHEEGVAILLRALKAGSTVGPCHTFSDSRKRVGQLLESLHTGSESAQAETRTVVPLIGRLPDRRRMVGAARVKSSLTDRQVIALSNRECSTLTLMSQGMSNKQIARCLHIAPETVKSHAKHLFVKLDVRSRTEAVACATRLGLI